MESHPQILNKADSYSFFDLISVYLKTFDHLNLKLLIFVGILHVLRFDFRKFRILNFNLCLHSLTLFQLFTTVVCSP